MEVIRSYDIARLVLGYLRDNKLDKAAKTFCKTSPYLSEEYALLRKGFWPVSLRHDNLPHIVREYCEIQSEVVQFIESLPEDEKDRFPKHGTLVSKVQLLIRTAKGALAGRSEVLPGSKRRKITLEETCTSLEATQEQDLPGYFPPLSKRRRLSPSFMCLANTRSKHIEVSSDEESLLVRSPCSTATEPDLNTCKSKSGTKLKTAELQTKKTKEATSTATTTEKQPNNAPIADFPAISEALLENVEFQNKLVENINKVLLSVKSPEPEKCDPGRNTCNSLDPSIDIVSQFEDMIKNILAETEKDPTFNELVEDIVLSNNPDEEKPSTSNQSTQCSPPIASCSPETVQTKPPQYELTLKERLRPRKANVVQKAALPTETQKSTSKDHSKEDSKGKSFFTPCKAATNTHEHVGDSSMSLSKLFILNPNETMATSTPLISDSLLGSSGTQLLNQLADNIFIDIGSGQAVPLLMANSMNTIFLDTSGDNVYDNLQLGKIIDSQNLETVDILPQNTIRIPVTTMPKRVDQPEVPVSAIKNDPPTSSEIAPVGAQSVVPPPSDHAGKPAEECSSVINEEKLTPSVPTAAAEMSRSLSTPRRKSSHIRVLNFKTPLKTRSETKLRYILPLIKSNIVEPAKDVPICPGLSEKRSITSAVNVNENTKQSTVLATINESSNSSSNIDFAKTNADATAIYQHISETPKRKSEGRQSCARILTEAESEGTAAIQTATKQTSSKKKTPKKTNRKKSRAKKESIEKNESEMSPNAPAIPVNPMEAWARLRSIAPGQWDQHIREVCAQEKASNTTSHTYKKKRRKTKNIPSQTKANEVQDTKTETNTDKTSNSAANETRASPLKQSTKKALIEFKIATPIKVGKSPGKTKSKASDIARGGISEVSNFKKDAEVEQQSVNSEVQCSEVQSNSHEKDTLEVDKQPVKCVLESRTNNIGLLLDTPLKVDPTDIPVTPGFRLPDTSTTPMIRILPANPSQISLCKNPDLPTPNFAITPGASLTPFEKDTPRSGYMSNNPTDYSSGSSYYKPDESEELDKKLDAILAENRRNAKQQNIRKAVSHNTDIQDGREASHEESSNQTVITTINRSSEGSSKVLTPLKQQSILPDDNSIFNSSSSSDSSKNTSASSSPSDSDTSLNTNQTVKNIELKSKNENHDENSDALKIEERTTVRNLLTPKKDESHKSFPIADPNSDKKLADLVDKIKSRSGLGQMKTQRIETLNEKLVRIKGELKKDFAVMNNKQSCVVPVKKKNTNARVKRPPARKKSPVVVRKPKCESQKTAREKIEVLAALNLSQKTLEQRTPLTRNPTTSKAFESDEIPKMQVEEDDSKESEETMEVRKAAYVLTNLSKGSVEQRRGGEVKKETKKASAKTKVGAAKRGQPKRLSSKTGESTVKKVYLPHKPVTRGTSKQNKCAPEKLDKDTSNVAVTFEVSQNAESVAVTAIPTSASKQYEPPVNAVGTNSKPLKALPSLTDLGESSSDQEEDYDQYDECETTTIGEKDTLRYIHVIYDESNANKQGNQSKNAPRNDNLASSIMNIFINGAPHQIVVADEIELFSNSPKPITKKKEKSVQEPSKKKTKTGDRKNKIEDTQPEKIADKESLGSSCVQPKINIKYKQRTTIKGKLKTDAIKCENSKSPLKVHFQPISPVEQEIVLENVELEAPSDNAEAAENQQAIKSEDIFAVLSLIHGN